ncbi:P2X purinoceptor 6-like [Otolemur garnettii]|uniref:P2X purinoceptor 6-like n=1 Tax=Otolemur garnettii TaxID=30611 RepID=UPI000643EBC9|nr:P2X purinoceptor 6-like [Otolemur garnettii]
MGSSGAAAGWGLLDYKTEKYVITRNWRVGALQRLLQFGIVAYVVGGLSFPIKATQERDLEPQISVITKLSGISVIQIKELGKQLEDIADYVKLSHAPWRLEGLEFILCFQGIKTDRCVAFNGNHKTCEIWTWCPVESGTVPTKSLFIQAQNFRLFIKNSVIFSKFNFFN